MGAPGWPEFAFCTASIASVRMVLMLRVSSCLPVSRVCSLATIGVLPSDEVIGVVQPLPHISGTENGGRVPHQAVYQGFKSRARTTGTENHTPVSCGISDLNCRP